MLLGKEMTRRIGAPFLVALIVLLASCAAGAYVDEYRFAESSATSANGISLKQVEALRAGFVAICRKHALTLYQPEGERFGWLHFSRTFDKWKEDFKTRYLVARFLVEDHRVTIEICTLAPNAEDHLAFTQEMEAMISKIVGAGHTEHVRYQRDGTLK